ncbi:nitrile hydratase accessory protein [Roseivivax isoporae]|uniref:Nitrile hydratase beta subunit-like N-terminal domain-containing protein n=1 Tax=Roseivivax isoporae LMG 25204 TaxID=1449351 RepID=X7F3B9_9RHOB|nr:nitrile hydratase accessory protein [Roseivivax isoporae]ETX27310.1 hypothetical protein RISW2_14530 [Roseivivax isoporae LMG 25204]
MTPADAPRFEAPWHAELFAMTVHLNKQGAFSWSDWTAALGESLARARAASGAPLDGGDDYYLAWLDALETLLEQAGTAPGAERRAMRAAWREAYLATPHGAPVTLGASGRDGG